MAVLVSGIMPSLPCIPAALAVESRTATLIGNTANGEFSLELDLAQHAKDRQEVETFLSLLEKQWNDHNLDTLMSYYADDYINNDGLDKKAVTDLTKEFWDEYPDAKSASLTKQIRIEGNYATVTSRDIAHGTAANEVPSVNGKGELSSVSEGQLYLKKFGNGWKIIGDRIDYEKVKVVYGLAKQLDVDFVAPEQVKASKKYAAKVEVKLPPGLAAVAEITSQNLQYPSVQQIFPNVPQTEIWKALDTNALEKDDFILERILEANSTNHNELLMTKIGITNAAKNSLVGFEFLTRRLNVVPPTHDEVAPTVAEKVDNKEDEAKETQTSASGDSTTPKKKSKSNSKSQN
jgi:hypothetical protein